ncbi:MAG TPA: hypothetical protein PKM50_02555 [Methanoregula sp.]|nr:hypothetical protein [Methanoregula sp.]
MSIFTIVQTMVINRPKKPSEQKNKENMPTSESSGDRKEDGKPEQ